MPAEPNRPEIDPPVTTAVKETAAVPPERPAQRRADDPDIADQFDRLIQEVGGQPGSFKAKLIRDLLVNALKLIPDGRDTGELKLITTAVKEMRYAYRVFAQYAEPHKVTIFGSARTPPDHPDYAICVEFSRLMAQAGWMIITGAGGGIMHAGHVGPGRQSSFGVAIRLPFETTANEVIAGDNKLIHFRYFFTRKLMFLSQAESVALFPGGFGTLDESFEVLTLIQTGKSSMIPIVLLEGEGGTYWEAWDRFVRDQLLARGLISPDDTSIYYMAKDPQDALDHIKHFYRNYHSMRYVKDDLVIRIKRPLAEPDVARLAQEFAPLIKTGTMVQRGHLEPEDDHLQLPRLVFHHTRSRFGLVRKLIDHINDCDPA
jgi:uncharacterized protein (TIGR00730 family)